MGFRYRPGLGISYDRQGLIFFTSRSYDSQPARVRRKIENLCRAAAGDNWRALFCYVTTDTGTVAVCQRFHLSENSLHRAVRKYYRLWEKA